MVSIVLIAIVAVHGAALTALALARMEGGRIGEVITHIYPVPPEPLQPDPPPKPAPHPQAKREGPKARACAHGTGSGVVGRVGLEPTTR